MEHSLRHNKCIYCRPRRKKRKERSDWFIGYGVSDLIVYMHSRIHIHPYTVNPDHMVATLFGYLKYHIRDVGYVGQQTRPWCIE